MTLIDIGEQFLASLEDVERVVEHLKGLGCTVVLTSGSFDLIHLGHVKYLDRAKQLGDILIVGVDDDEKISSRKGPDRPMVPEQERMELLAYQRPVDLLYLKSSDDPKWALIGAVRPDVLVLTADHRYGEPELSRLRELVGRIEVVERQSVMTTSERIRQMYMNLGEKLGPMLAKALPGLIEETLKRSKA